MYETYLFRKNRLLWDFVKSLTRVKLSLYSWLGQEQAMQLIRESRQEYEALIPRIPFIGRDNPLLVFLLPATRYLAVYRKLQQQGHTIEDAGHLAFEIGIEELRAIPSIGHSLIDYLWFSPLFIEQIKRRAQDSQQHRYPGDYVLTFVEGDGQESDYGVDYLECASCKLLQAENAFELAPYVSAVDKTASELLGWGLTRTMTLAERSHKCDFRFKKGGETRVAIPQSLQTHFGMRSI